MPLIVLTSLLIFSLWLTWLLVLPFDLLSTFSLPVWLYLMGAVAFLSWCLHD